MTIEKRYFSKEKQERALTLAKKMFNTRIKDDKKIGNIEKEVLLNKFESLIDAIPIKEIIGEDLLKIFNVTKEEFNTFLINTPELANVDKAQVMYYAKCAFLMCYDF